MAAPATGALGCAAPGSLHCLRICPNTPSYCRVVALAAKEVAKPTWLHTAHCAGEGAEVPDQLQDVPIFLLGEGEVGLHV